MTHGEESKFQSGSLSSDKLDHLKQVLKTTGAKSVPPSTPPADAEHEESSDKDLQKLKNALDFAEREMAILAEKLKEAQKMADEARLRSLAELENDRSRLRRDREEMIRYANEGLLRELLTTVDNLERTVAHITPGDVAKNVHDGMQLVLRQLLATLTTAGLSEIEAKKDLPFDPHTHEAIAKHKVEGVAAHAIIEVLQKGYRYHDRLLRPARVVIAE